MTSVVGVWRGAICESVHGVHVAVADAHGELRAWSGDAERVTIARSAVKPIQALPLVEDGVVERFDVSARELGLACGSHGGEPMHVEVVRGLLERLDLPEDALACGAHAPLNRAAARALRAAGGEPRRVHNNCSGKHAGMLALALAHGWPADGYHAPEHPVQRRMLAEVARWTGVAEEAIGLAVDGCGVSTFALPLRGLATAFARLGARAAAGDAGPARIVAAMTSHPEMVGGTDRLCTDLMRETRGRVIAKVGAEGVYCAGAPEQGTGIALKVEDGAVRAAQPALLEALAQLGLLTAGEVRALEAYARPDLRNTRDEVVGSVRATIRLEGKRE